VTGLFKGGQGWEMLTLPRLARGALLVNFCNLAPVLHGNSVVMIHDAQTFLHPDDYSGRQASAYRLLLPLIGRRARRVLTVSDFAKASLLEHGIGRKDRIETVYNGTDHILSCPPDTTIFERHNITPGNYVLALGTLKGYKNLARVFAAMQAPAPAGMKLVIAGGPPEVQYRPAGLTPPEGTVFTGFVSDGELRALYEGARVFAFPSLTEGFGLPPLEAMQCGTPVIAARAGAMVEVCTEGAKLGDPRDTDAWRDAIAALAGPEGVAQARLGHARAARFTWEAAGARLWEVIRPLLQ
jgi:glycosyltransferase involved in cell wall biosynthesis